MRSMFQDHGGQGGPRGRNWKDLYFHQKVKHLADTAGEYVFAWSSWWLPALAISSAFTVMMFSGPMGLPQLMQAGSLIASPIPPPSVFGMEMPQHPGGGGGGAPEDDDEDM